MEGKYLLQEEGGGGTWEKWYCLNRMLKKSKDRWQIILKNTSKQNIIENSNSNNTDQWL